MTILAGRPDFENIDPALRNRYAAADQLTLLNANQILSRLRAELIADIRLVVPPSLDGSFDYARYETLQRTMRQLASDLERALAAGGFTK